MPNYLLNFLSERKSIFFLEFIQENTGNNLHFLKEFPIFKFKLLTTNTLY